MAYTPKYDYRAKDALPSGNTNKIIRGSELMEEFELLAADSLLSPITVSCKYNGSDLRYSTNVDRVEQTGNNTFVYFKNQIPEFDDHYAVTITPFVYLGGGGTGQLAVSVLNGFTSEYVSFSTKVEDKGQWVDPATSFGFSLLVVDMLQN